MFLNRMDAAQQLADRLVGCKDKHPLVLAIPRGAVPMGKLIAERLHGDLDVVLVRKLRAPYCEEVAIGAIDERGWTYVSPHAARLGADQDYIAAEKHAQMAVISERRHRYTPLGKSIDPTDRWVIVVDDGLATGATMIAALHSLRRAEPRKLICAVPVASAEALSRVRPLADEVVCLHVPIDLHSIGQHYQEFNEVSDADVMALLSSMKNG
ncbi:MAG: hypothetical protein RL406_310 [Pseudomonadota bacterium]|jgi:putative phosphoribosyl transferase